MNFTQREKALLLIAVDNLGVGKDWELECLFNKVRKIKTVGE